MHGAKSALITYVQFKFHVIDLKGNYSHGWIASADTSVIIFSSIFNTSSTFYTCFPVVRSNWGRLLRLAHLATFFRRLILSTSHVFFHQPTVLKKLKAFQLWGRYLLNCEMGSSSQQNLVAEYNKNADAPPMYGDGGQQLPAAANGGININVQMPQAPAPKKNSRTLPMIAVFLLGILVCIAAGFLVWKFVIKDKGNI